MMKGPELQAIRERFGLARIDFGLLLGINGENRNIYITVKRYEMGARPISPTVERLARMLSWFEEDYGYLPDLENGSRQIAVGLKFRNADAG